MRIFTLRIFAAMMAWLFCFRAASSTLPDDITMNPGAGHGGLLFVNIRIDDGEELPFVLDTGCPTTCLDQSLEPKLGKRLRTDALWSFGVKSQINVYIAPKLYLGKTLLTKVGPLVVTHDCAQMSASVGRPIMGVLGMDVLQNYCVQLDFDAGKVRFLDADHTSKSKWGMAFSISNIGDGCPTISDNLTAMPGVGSLIDTGCNYDGWLIPQLYQQWMDPHAPTVAGQSHAPEGILGGQTYANLDLHGVKPKSFASGDTHIQFNGVGLSFLARHLVTMDFPEQTLYLKRASPDADDDSKAEAKAAAKALKMLEQDGMLPGWAKADEMRNNSINFRLDSGVITFEILKKRDSSTYHYTLARMSKDDWQLKRAWRTDESGHIAQEYPIQ